MFSVLFVLCFVSSALAQTGCSDGGVGPCLNSACATGFTCVTAIDTCCDTANLLFDTTVATTVATTAATTATTTCVDKVNPSTGVSDCTARASLCNDSVYYAVMTDQCPSTCGRCTTTTNTTTTCADKVNPTTGVSDCTARASLCNDSVYYAVMTDQCPSTCGRCNATTVTSTVSTTTTCADLVNAATGVSDCASRAYLCTNSAYATLMATQCPLTCGKCSG